MYIYIYILFIIIIVIIYDDQTPNSNAAISVNSIGNSTYSKSIENLKFPSNDTPSGTFAFELVKILERWYKCNGWPTSHNVVRIPESFRW